MKNTLWIAAAAAALAGSAGAQSIGIPGFPIDTFAPGGGASAIGLPSLGANGLGMPSLSPLPPVSAIGVPNVGVPNVAEPFDGCPFAMQILCLPTNGSPATGLGLGAGSSVGGVSGGSLGIGGLVPGVINVPPLDLAGGASGIGASLGGAAVGTSPASGLTDFLLTPPLDPLGVLSPPSGNSGASPSVGVTVPVAPGAGGAFSAGGSTFGTGGFDRMFCRPEDFACL